MDHQAFAQLLGNYGEFLGALAVVATLGYLTLQIRQNSKMMKATVRQEFATSSIDLIMRIADHPKVQGKIFSQDNPQWESEEEELVGQWIMTAAFRSWENAAWQHKEGLMPTTEWTGLVEDMKHRSTFPYCVDQWRQTRERFSVYLQETVDPIFAITNRD